MLREVPPRTLVAGAPAREIGAISGNPALDMDQIQVGAGVATERAYTRLVELVGMCFGGGSGAGSGPDAGGAVWWLGQGLLI